jgi:hypothetical protein
MEKKTQKPEQQQTAESKLLLKTKRRRIDK